MAKRNTGPKDVDVALRRRPRQEAHGEPGPIDIIVGKEIAATEDEQFVQQAWTALRQFFGGVAAFFAEAQQLELASRSLLGQAKLLQPPTSAAEDEAIQRFIKHTSAHKRKVEEHWQITTLVSQFHRRLTARRSVSTDAADQANKIGNTLHNAYEQAELRRVAAEQERIRREVEAQAQRARDEELARMEAEAVAREEASADLSEREQAFVEAYLSGIGTKGNGQQSAARAGYKEPLKAAARLLSAPKIQKAIQAREEAIAIRRQAEAVREAPLEFLDVPTVEAEISKAPGAVSRTTHSYEIVDEEAFVRAALAGKHGIPADALTYKPAAMTDYARSLRERIELWPGVRYVKTTKII